MGLTQKSRKNMESKTNKKIVIFESIEYFFIPLVFFYLKLRYKVRYFEVNARGEKQNWFQRALAQHQLEKIAWESLDLELQYSSHDMAFDNIEGVYSRRFAKSRLIRKMASLLKSEMVHATYKKALITKLQYFYHIQVLLNDIARRLSPDTVIFVPLEFIEIRNLVKSLDAANDLDNRIHIPFWAHITCYIYYATKKIKWAAVMALLSVWELLHVKRVAPGKVGPKSYQVGIRIYATDLGFNYRLRSIDFLLDGNNLNADNTLFCIETAISEDYRQRLKERKYNVVEVPKILAEVDWSFIKNMLIQTFFPYCCISAILSFLQPPFVAQTTIGILHWYLLWTRFIEMYHVKHYVVYNDFGKTDPIRNTLLSQKGTQTWYYEHSCHSGYTVRSPESKVSMRHIIFAYLYYDNLVCWGNEPMRYLKAHLSYVKRYLNLGTLWSEHVRMLAEGNAPSTLPKAIIKKMKIMPGKIIAVYDTTFGKDVPLQSNDIALFIEGILKLLEDNSQIGVIFKEKNPFEWVKDRNPEVALIYEKLRTHERCYATGNTCDAAETIAASDLVVSACFTSCTVEALGARRKGIYFDATNRFKGYYYDRFPKLVAHGYEELRKLVQYWLYDITADEFDNYLKAYVKGELDAYVDGRAITRFRELLR